jgi:tripartite-type tricarboxylate transporter receptor subunit TctC
MLIRIGRWRLTSMAALLAGLVAGLPGPSQAAYPERPIQLVVPFPAGGSTDVVARIVAAKMGELLGQQMVVDNRAGAGGNVGAAAV